MKIRSEVLEKIESQVLPVTDTQTEFENYFIYTDDFSFYSKYKFFTCIFEGEGVLSVKNVRDTFLCNF